MLIKITQIPHKNNTHTPPSKVGPKSIRQCR